ncbi:putative MnhB-related membrane protein [Natranaerovirga pectinivora]|uniref:Putative MnhB-related membrane protein n=1 Tax=Natranaerovirga pectinivora TaxID=682400 RepID=A0A4R3MLE7_9FIRM|nr:DUF4040 domain-containing protein [Natranaerovirga pectinivora]TCT15458.1 putative MnhB-related membrane protein [Natranaerovirga pectinivora]
MSEKIILILTVIFAFLSIQTLKLNRAVIYLGMFGFLCSLLYLFYRSPNVAIAEAVIGSTLTTVIYLVALRRQKRFKVYVYNEIDYNILDAMETFGVREDLIFQYIRYSEDQYSCIVTERNYDLLMHKSEDNLLMISKGSNYKIEGLAATLAKNKKLELNVILNEMRESDEVGNI